MRHRIRQSHLIILNGVIIWVARILLLFPQLILLPYLIGTIGESGYGVYALIWSLMMSIEQLHSSLQSGVVKYSAAFLAQGRTGEVNKVVSSSFVYSLLLAVLACVGTLIVAVVYNDPSGQISTALYVVGLMILFIFPLTPYIAVIQSHQLYYVGAIAETVSKYIGLLAVVIWFSIVRPSVEALIIIMAIILFLSRLAQIPFAYRLLPGLRNRLRLFDRTSFRLIATFGATMILISICLAVNSTGIRWLMDSLVSTSFVTHLVIMLMPGLLLSQIIGAMTITIMPATSAYEATGNQRMLQELLIRGMRYTMILVLAGLFVAGLLMRNLLSIWLGPNYVFLAPYALVLFASMSFMISTSVAHHMLKGMGKLKVVVFIYGFGFVIVPIGLLLIIFQIWHDPYIAVVVGLAMGYLVCGFLQMGFCTKIIHVDLHSVLIRVYAQPVIVAIAVCVVIISIITISGIDYLFERICISALAILLFFSGCYAIIATTTERQQVKGVIQLAKRKITLNRKKPEAN